jgi:hypothetical protein
VHVKIMKNTQNPICHKLFSLFASLGISLNSKLKFFTVIEPPFISCSAMFRIKCAIPSILLIFTANKFGSKLPLASACLTVTNQLASFINLDFSTSTVNFSGIVARIAVGIAERG